MSDIHRHAFTLYLMELDARRLSQAQRGELQSHLAACPACRADQKLYQGLHNQAGRRWLASTPHIDREKVLRNAQSRLRMQRVLVPLRAVAWVGLAVLALVLAQWIFTFLRPAPVGVPNRSPTPTNLIPESTPTASAVVAGEITVEPLLRGVSAGQGSWSPQGDYYFTTFIENPIPGSDRRSTGLHFISASTGQDCPASEAFLGTPGFQNYAWLDNERVLFIDRQGRPLLFTRCQPGVQDLSDRFNEPLLRVATPTISTELASPGPLLLEAASAYWLLDPATLQARPLDDPRPSPGQVDSFAWVPSGHQMSVIQPSTEKPELSRLVVLDLDSGDVLRSVELEASAEGRGALVEWMGPEKPFVWSFGAGGPLLVDLSSDPPQQVRVLPELFKLDLAYPDQINSMGVFSTPGGGSFHIVTQVNLPDDGSTYIYHSESGQIEKLDGSRAMLLILPGDQRMPLIPQEPPVQATPYSEQAYDVVWVDAPERSPVHLEASGHTPRNYPRLASHLLPGSTRLLLGSSQGISLVDLTSGETLAFWRLSGAEDVPLPNLMPDPQGRVTIVVAGLNESSLLYWLPLPEGAPR